jgi:hypothetical protein
MLPTPSQQQQQHLLLLLCLQLHVPSLVTHCHKQHLQPVPYPPHWLLLFLHQQQPQQQQQHTSQQDCSSSHCRGRSLQLLVHQQQVLLGLGTPVLRQQQRWGMGQHQQKQQMRMMI